jgi:hypothetical protein
LDTFVTAATMMVDQFHELGTSSSKVGWMTIATLLILFSFRVLLGYRYTELIPQAQAVLGKSSFKVRFQGFMTLHKWCKSTMFFLLPEVVISPVNDPSRFLSF